MRQPTVVTVVDGAEIAFYLTGAGAGVTPPPALAGYVTYLRDRVALHAPTMPRAATFEDLDPRSQSLYRAIRACLPAQAEVYATGSRVQGYWRSGRADDAKTALAARLGKSAESDVDVMVRGADVVVCRRLLVELAKELGVAIDLLGYRPPAIRVPD